MSISFPVRTIDNGLVFYYDTSSPRSYVGQPTTNYVTYPLANWNGSGFALSYNYANNNVSYTFDTSVSTPIGDYSGVMRYYTGNTDYKYWSILMTGLSSGTYAFSYYAKASVAGGINNSQLWRDSGTDRSISGDWNPSYTTEWKRYVTVGPISVGSYLDYFPIHSGALTGGVYVYFWGFQLEKLSYATPLAIGTRSNTQGLLDMMGAYTIDLSNAGYDGSGNLLYSANQNISAGDMGAQFQNFTVEIWFKSNDVVNYRNPIDCNWLQYNGSYSNIGPRLEQNSSGTLGWVIGDVSGNYQNVNVVSSGLDASKYHQAIITKDGTAVKSYYNGALVTSTTATYTHPGYFKNVQIGRGFSTSSERWFNGYIPLTKIYNRALSGDEILINYNANKGRFGLL